MVGYRILFAIILFSVFTLTSENQHHHDEDDDDNHRRMIAELQDCKLRIALLEFVLEENIQKINENSKYIEESQKLIDEMMHKIPVLSKIKDDSSRAEGRLAALEEEIRLLWAASRRNNFDIHNLESNAQDSEDKLEEVTSQVEKMAEIVIEQWIQIQHLEQVLHMAELRAMNVQRQLRFTRCTFLKFVNELSGKHIPKLFGMPYSYLSGKGSILSFYMSQAVQQFKRFFLAFKKFHHQLQGFIKQEMVKNELTAALANEELVFFVASALIIFPALAAWMLLSSQFC